MASVFLWFMLIIVLTLLSMLGLVLIILGIAKKKKSMWISGTVIMLCIIIFCVAGFMIVLRKAILSAKYETSYFIDNYAAPRDYEDENSQSDTTYNSDDLRSEGDEYITGFIQDADKSLVHIKVIPDAILKDLGITINKIDTYSATGSKNKTISLNIDFSKKFKGELQLLLYSSDSEEIGKSLVQISQNENSAFTVNFLYDNETNFLKTEYARLKSSD
jgi:hypothetical protein